MTFDCLKKEVSEKLRHKVIIANLIGAILILASEITIAYFFYLDQFVTDIFEYSLVRIIIPSLFSFSALFISILISRKHNVQDKTKNYVSIGSMFVLCSVVSIFHNYYTLLLVAVVVPFFMCSAFGDKKLLNSISIATIPVTLFSFLISYHEKSINTDSLYRFTTFLCCVVFIIVAYVCANVIMNIQKTQMDYLYFSNNNERELIERLQLDHLTELNNRNSLKDGLADAIKRYIFGNDLYCLVMIDVDHFKQINDSYGHLKGDIVLKNLSRIIKKHLVDGDSAYRFGGEEFLVLMMAKPENTVDCVYKEIQKMAEEFKSTEYDFCEGKKIIFSAGICSCKDILEIDEWIKRADEAMYVSKSEGRDRITVYNKE